MKKILIYLCLLLAFWQLQAITVTRADDAVVWNGTKNVGANGTFRWAIEEANKLGTSAAQTIDFAASLNGQTIKLDFWQELTLRVPNVTIDGANANITVERIGVGSALVLLDVANAANEGPIIGANSTIIKNLNWKNASTVIGALAIASDKNEIIDCSFVNGGGLYIGFLQYAWDNGTPINKANENKVYYTAANGTLEGSLFIIGDLNDVTKLNINGDLILGAIDNLGSVVANSNTNVIHEVSVRDFTRLIGDNNNLTNSSFGDFATSKGRGVQVEGANTKITNSTVHVGEKDPALTDNPTAGIYVRPGSNSITIDQVVLTNNLGIVNELPSGVRLGDWGNGVTGSKVTNVKVSGYFNGVLGLNSVDNRIEDSEFFDNTNVGLFLASSSDNSLVSRIQSYRNGPGGIQVDNSSNVVISESKIYDNASNGVTFTNSPNGNTIQTSYVYGNKGGEGIWMSNSSKVKVLNNSVGIDDAGVVSGNANNGINLDAASANNLIEGNTVVASGQSGINIDASEQNAIFSNDIGNVTNTDPSKENTVNGISLINGSQRNVIGLPTKGNNIKAKVGQNAIVVDGATTVRNKIRGNSTSGNAGKGILLSNAGNKNYGGGDAVTFNTAEIRPNMISGRAPAIGDTIDIYISVDGTCQTPGAGTPQGATWAGYVIAIANANPTPNYSGPIWELDFITIAGLTKDNVVVTATQAVGVDNLNTSEFAQCVEDLACIPPTASTIVDPGVDDFCENTTVDLSVTLQSGYNYTWYKGLAIVKGPTLNDNTLTVTETGDYKVVIEDVSSPAACNTTSNVVSLTKRDNPIIDGNIVGKSPVCKSVEDYELQGQTVNYDLIQWINPLNNGATYKNGVSTGTKVDVDFSAVTDIATTIDLSVVLSKGYPKGVTCSSVLSVGSTLKVKVEDDPTLSFVNSLPQFICKTTGNIVEIAAYDPTFLYELVSNSGTGITVTVPIKGAVSGNILVDITNAAAGGTIIIRKTSDTGCSVEETFTVTVIGCGRTLGFDAPGDKCSGNSLTFTSTTSPGPGETIAEYHWKFSTIGSVTLSQNQFDGPTFQTVTLQANGDGKVVPSLFVVFSSDPTNQIEIPVEKGDTVVVNPNPTLNSLIVTKGIDDVCEGDTIKYQFDPHDSPNYTYSWTGATEYASTDSAYSVNGASGAGYTVSLKAEKTYGALVCSSVKSVNRDEKRTPWLGNILHPHDSVLCDLNAFDPLYTFSVGNRDIINYKWEFIGDDPGFQSPQNNDSIDVIFPKYGQYKLRVIGTGEPICNFKDTSETIINIDHSFLVEHEIISSKDKYCEGDTGSFYVIQKVTDRHSLFGTHPYHYSEFTWDYNRDTTKQENLWIDSTKLKVGDETFYTAFYNPNDTVYVKYPNAKDSTNSGTYGAFNSGDKVFFGAKPLFCYHYNSILADTVILDSLIELNPKLNLAINEDHIHVITDVVTYPSVEITDKENTNPSFDDKLTYELTWGLPSGVIIGAKTEVVKLEIENFELDSLTKTKLYDTIMFTTKLTKGICSVKDTAYLVFDYGIFIPTAFTPGGEHPKWHIENIEKFSNSKVQVYNRWGSMLYEVEDYANNEWDGTYEGEVLPIASYYFIVKLNEGADPISGAVSILK